MKILRSVASTSAAAIVATALPTAFAFSSSSSSSTSSSSSSKSLDLRFLSPTPVIGASRFGLSKSFSSPISALHMDNQKLTSQEDVALPELQTEFMVDMKCEGCVKSVRTKLETVKGIKNIEVDLSNQIVRILGSTPVKLLEEALEQTGFKARLIGQGVPEDFLISAAVAEFKGPDVFGVVRLAQVSMELARIEANFSGLSPGKHGWSINDFGDLTRGVASTGKVYNPTAQGSDAQPVGDLGTLDADDKGEAFYSGVKPNLKIADLIGRSIAIYNSENRSDSGLAAAVIARSAGVGENYKKLCTCDGTTIWEATNNDFVSKDNESQPKYELDQDRALRSLNELDQQLESLLNKPVPQPKIRASNLPDTLRDQMKGEEQALSGPSLAYGAFVLFLFTVLYNIIFLTVIKPSIDIPYSS